MSLFRKRSIQIIILASVSFYIWFLFIWNRRNNVDDAVIRFQEIYYFSFRKKRGLIYISHDIDLNGLCDKRLSKNHIPGINHVEFQKIYSALDLNRKRVWLKAIYIHINRKLNIILILQLEGGLISQFPNFLKRVIWNVSCLLNS